MPSSGRRHGDVTDRDLSFDPGTAVRGGLQLLHRIAKAAQNTLICAANVAGSRAL